MAPPLSELFRKFIRFGFFEPGQNNTLHVPFSPRRCEREEVKLGIGLFQHVECYNLLETVGLKKTQCKGLQRGLILEVLDQHHCSVSILQCTMGKFQWEV